MWDSRLNLDANNNIIIIIAHAKLRSSDENEWGDLECLYKACQAATTDGGLFTDTVGSRDSSSKIALKLTHNKLNARNSRETPEPPFKGTEKGGRQKRWGSGK